MYKSSTVHRSTVLYEGMGGVASAARLRVQVVLARDALLLSRFFDADPGDLSIEEYFESHVRPRIIAEAGVYKLVTARVALNGEEEMIEVTSKADKCADYLSMGLKRVVFEVASAAQSRNESPAAPENQEEDDATRGGIDGEGGEEEEEVVVSVAEPAREMRTPPAVLPKNEKQKSMGYFFGMSLQKKYGRDVSGKKVLVSSGFAKLEDDVNMPLFSVKTRHCRYCSKGFTHGPALVHHEKACQLMRTTSASPITPATIEAVLEQEIGERRREETEGEVEAQGEAAEGEQADGEQADGEQAEHHQGDSAGRRANDAPATAPSQQKKLLKDGTGTKKSGLREGQKRGTSRTIYFKYEVVMYYREMQALKEKGLCPNPGGATQARFSGITLGQISAWAKLEAQMKETLLEGNQQQRRGSKRDKSLIVSFSSAKARKLTLHPGRGRKFAAAEAELHNMYRQMRARGLRVKGYWLRVQMKRLVVRIYGEAAAATFKASKSWLVAFTDYYSMSLRRRSNKKNVSVEERATKCKRWHARFRRRLRKGVQRDPKWGRWLPEDRISLDQVSTA